MIAVLVPAHNEAGSLGACLDAILKAADHPHIVEEVRILVATDRCTDQTAAIALGRGAEVVLVPAPGGVGMARAAAATRALNLGARWLAMTDADSIVPREWLVEQQLAGADAFCGVVEVEDWQDYPEQVRLAFTASQDACDGHARVHGANLGVSAEFYLRCGGFLPLLCGEDVALVQALVSVNATIARLARPVVRTSARRQSRASGGFADYLQNLQASVRGPLPACAGAPLME